MSFKYRNKSQFYKRLTINGKRVNIQPGGIIESDREMDLEIHDFLEKAEAGAEATVRPREEKKKVEVASADQYDKLEQAILKLHSKIITAEEVKKMVDEILASTPAIEKEELEKLAQDLKGLKDSLTENPNAQLAQKITELETELKQNINRRQHVLKDAIDEVNKAVVSLEKYVYEGDWDNFPLVVVDDKEESAPTEDKPKDTGPSIEDILRGN